MSALKRLPALLFPGQGNQQRAMLSDYLEKFPSVVRPILEELDESLKQSFSKLLVNSTEADAMLPDINLTSNAQPAILTASYTILQILKSQLGSSDDFLKSTFSFTLGHSLGEFTAATAAGVLQFSDAVALVHQRGKAMEQSKAQFLEKYGSVVELGMYVVLFPKHSSAEIVEFFDKQYRSGTQPSEDLTNFVDLGNINSNSQIVFSGPKTAVSTILADIQAHLGLKKPFRTIPLNVSAPFHSPVMKPAQDHMETLVAKLDADNKIAWPGQIPIVSNITAKPFDSKERILRSLSHSCTDRVYWYDSIKYVTEQESVDRLVAIGPGNVSDLTKRDVPKSVQTDIVNAETLDSIVNNF